MTHLAGGRGLRAFKAPLWIGLVYVAVLGVVATFPSRAVGRLDAKPSASPATAADTYAVCGIDQTSDPRTGRCVPLSATPLPCVQGSHFDRKAGFCMPVAASPPPPSVVTVPQMPSDPFANMHGIHMHGNDSQGGDPFGNP